LLLTFSPTVYSLFLYAALGWSRGRLWLGLSLYSLFLYWFFRWLSSLFAAAFYPLFLWRSVWGSRPGSWPNVR
jgi:hypothetical protein